ncbi:hypothetical protein TPHA_0G02960 [Tetrapisispora phaffii CBS 4417]|uniref:MYND-type domain-containing protein n=1 Tax=Tetrapisispora phaffii (strain ATCC 24235 / CBS 4417 / NBRC 1672 / NRRL Y-8282 / UCD 70-5) TaxID=1071381 RepID=G8BW59_TETPH|nr:hypothetical protein TPHA_0G02960 [Tetrapisispora phaffii CBS 4417]CCE64137.1 hypothetical protein TPHA_0G02960 [Tetrapisispora phaffii CBS 4417]
MRDSNFRAVLSNRPIVPITQTVYDRKSIDIDSSIPLINSLNNLTYLTSNSGKIRETISNDGSLERLMSILQNCHLPLFDVLFTDGDNISIHKKHTRVRNICKEKKLALCSWKWTLAFQCLVLTGTRGTEKIREKVVSSGVVSLLATVLDNFLLFHKKFDFVSDKKISFATENITFDNLLSRETFMYMRSDLNESYEEYVSYLLGYDFNSYNDIENLYIVNYLNNSDDYNLTMASDFADIWNSDFGLFNNNIEKTEDNRNININMDDSMNVMEDADMLDETNEEEILSPNKVFTASPGSNNTSESNSNRERSEEDLNNIQSYIDKDCFSIDMDHAPLISIPRSLYFGKIIPKQDDVIWSLQLLAFISKYSYMKNSLQNCKLIDSLSFRSIIDRVNKRIDLLNNNNDSSKFTSSKNSQRDTTDDVDIKMEEHPTTEQKVYHMNVDQDDGDDKFLSELIAVQQKYSENNVNETSTSNKRIELNKKVKRNFKENWNYNNMDKTLTEETWKSVVDKMSVNIFPLVEKFTVTELNSHDMIYWSSVIMRNSCKKDEINNIRQCANFECGKWESYPREFAKCRRCKRTKYCSRECQLKGWAYHRYWCHEVGTSVNNRTAADKNQQVPNSAADDNIAESEQNGANGDTQTNSDSREGTVDATPNYTGN